VAEAEEFPDFVRAASAHLLHTAWLLTGDQHRAEDLVQSALARTYAAWPRVRTEDAVAYTRRVLVNAQHDWWRGRTWREQPTDRLPDGAAGADPAGRLHDRDALVRALGRLGVRERTVVVLRYYADLDIDAVADLLGISTGAVKSAASRALAKLRVSTDLIDERTDDLSHDGGLR
jgi:RNA polymerase sigma-70 factor (sigma-E family)